MSLETPVNDPTHSLLPTDVGGVELLAELALDLHWSWNHCTDEVWRQLDPALWHRTQNPWVVLQSVSRERLQRALADKDFFRRVDDLAQFMRRTTEAPAWFQKTHAQSALTRVGYFSMEYMLSEALPIYSGGLGNVAGDQLKVLVNGGLNVSELDGWWAEAYTPDVGWALGDGQEHGDDPTWDAAEAAALYDLLEREIVPQFYARDENDIPPAWIARMRESMTRLTPRFSTDRAVRPRSRHCLSRIGANEATGHRLYGTRDTEAFRHYNSARSRRHPVATVIFIMTGGSRSNTIENADDGHCKKLRRSSWPLHRSKSNTRQW